MRLGKTGLWTAPGMWEPGSAEHREAAAELEDLGYGTLWLGNTTGDLAEVSALLDATRRLVVGSSIVNVWLNDSATLAAAYRQAAGAHPGRVVVGLGSSHAPLVEGAGQDYRKPYSKLRSYLDELAATEPPVPGEDQMLAALGPRTLALAGERTAGALPYLTTPEHTAQAREILGDGPLLAPEQKVVLETDPVRAREIARETLAMYMSLPNYVNNWRRLGFTEHDVADRGSDRLVDALVAWGDVDTVLARVREHRAAGADHVALQVLTGSPGLPLAEWRELAPAVRES
ncbi:MULTISPECIES: LLM class F420-dependent oxidoreductase [Streptomyces]|uniref:LLM class F420-dependent oxidoreductase n=1 Tax=Streptomyces lycii TaxID=2654337 RepID=A0ABQ7FG13_9ACTN|nr:MULTISPECIES: LLM class F420-dependent oxidoreductase [Streptomyces]KAF4407575.1 LLM class F420-dependent oxidoreductase [Streptomyces lycii]PGH49625.1 LLM class F420-dependent oxidoreductase [Streptomyces sp. Ru87]